MGCFLKESHASSSARASIATDPDCSLSAVCPYSPCSVSSRSLYDSMAFCFVCRDANSQRNVPVETLMSSRAFWMVFEYCWDSRLLSSASGFACWYWDTAVIRRGHVLSPIIRAEPQLRCRRSFVSCFADDPFDDSRTVFADTSYGRQLIYKTRSACRRTLRIHYRVALSHGCRVCPD